MQQTANDLHQEIVLYEEEFPVHTAPQQTPSLPGRQQLFVVRQTPTQHSQQQLLHQTPDPFRQTTPIPRPQQLPPRSTASSQQQRLLGRTTPLPIQKQQLVVRQTTPILRQPQPSTSQQYFARRTTPARQTTPLLSQQQQYLRQPIVQPQQSTSQQSFARQTTPLSLQQLYLRQPIASQTTPLLSLQQLYLRQPSVSQPQPSQPLQCDQTDLRQQRYERVQRMNALSRNTNLGPVSSSQQHQPSAQAASSAPRDSSTSQFALPAPPFSISPSVGARRAIFTTSPLSSSPASVLLPRRRR